MPLAVLLQQPDLSHVVDPQVRFQDVDRAVKARLSDSRRIYLLSPKVVTLYCISALCISSTCLLCPASHPLRSLTI